MSPVLYIESGSEIKEEIPLPDKAKRPDSRAETAAGSTTPQPQPQPQLQPPAVQFNASDEASKGMYAPTDSMQGMYSESHAYVMMWQSVVHTVRSCASMCDHTVTLLLCKPDVAHRFQQIQNLRDCVGICNETAYSLAGQRPFARKFVKLCAKVCYMCGTECLRHPDAESQKCGQMCMSCAEDCKRIVAVGVY